jgi:hypothetical protein
MILTVAACGTGRTTATPAVISPAPEIPGPTHTPRSETAVPQPATQQVGGIVAGEVEVRYTSSYVDNYGYYHVVGEVFNSTELTANNIEISVRVVDAAGQSVITDSSGQSVESVITSALLFSLAPGEGSPFDIDFYAAGSDTGSWRYEAAATWLSATSVDRGSLKVQNDQIATDEFGTIYVTGELANLGNEPVLVTSLAAALLGQEDTVRAAGSSYTFARYLAAAGDASGLDSTPFVMTLDGPVDGYSEASFYWESAPTDPIENPGMLEVALINNYVDVAQRVNLVMYVTNHGNEIVNVSLVAGLYDAGGGVLDAASVVAPLYVQPGETLPVTIDYFSRVNTIQADAQSLDHFRVQVDPYWTDSGDWDVVSLETDSETNEFFGDGIVTFGGQVANISDRAISSATLILAIYDGEGNLVTSNWTNVFPDGEFVSPGQSMPFNITLYLPPGADTSAYSFLTFVQGYLH